MALSAIDRRLLDRCLANEPHAWEEFVDRFMGLVLHVVDHTTQGGPTTLHSADREDLVAEVFVHLIADDYRVLRQFRGESSLATFLTVVARRSVIRQLSHRHASSTLQGLREAARPAATTSDEQRIEDRDELEQMIARLKGPEADVVRMYHLEGKSYREISARIGVPENTIGPTLSRARSKMRSANSDSAVR